MSLFRLSPVLVQQTLESFIEERGMECLIIGGSAAFLAVPLMDAEWISLRPKEPAAVPFSDTFLSRTVFISFKKAAILSGGIPIAG